MSLQRITWSIPGKGSRPTPDDLVTMFHGWIQESRVGQMLLDVHNYSHVPVGPGVLLVGDEAHYRVEQNLEGWAFTYLRKRRLEGTLEERLALCLGEAARAATILLDDIDAALDPRAWTLRLEDRLLYPNAEGDAARLSEELKIALATCFGLSENEIHVSPAVSSAVGGPASFLVVPGRDVSVQDLADAADSSSPSAPRNLLA